MILGQIAVEPTERFPIGGEFHQCVDLILARPDIRKHDSCPILCETQWFGRQILEHGPGNGICHHQRRRSKEVCADTGVNSRFEIAIAGEHRGANQIIDPHRFLDGFG